MPEQGIEPIVLGGVGVNHSATLAEANWSYTENIEVFVVYIIIFFFIR